jgi:hypothetical protein
VRVAVERPARLSGTISEDLMTVCNPRQPFVIGLAIVLALTSSLVYPGSVLAHERREVGKYQFVVGFINEPALQGEPNGVDLRVVNGETQQPVEGLQSTLRVAISFGGGQPKELPLRARFGMPGSYAADVIPTRPGAYLFTFSGTIEGQQINERFESGPGRFNDVEAATAVQFPVSEPSAGELQQALHEARQQAATANTLAVAGLVAGLLALLLSGYLLARRTARTGAMATKAGPAD